MRHQSLDELDRDGKLPADPSAEAQRARALAQPVTRAELIELIDRMEGHQRYNSLNNWLHRRWGIERRITWE